MKCAPTLLPALLLGLAAGPPLVAAAPAPAASSSTAASSVEAEQRAALAELDQLSAAGKLQSDEGKALRTGEAAEWIGPDLEGGLAPDKLIQISPDRAVARTPAGKVPQDTYTYLDKVDGHWKISAERTLALSFLLREYKEDLEGKPARTADEEALLRNVRLIVASDAELGAWFRSHAAEIAAIKDFYVASGSNDWVIAKDNDTPGPLADRLRALGLAGIGRSEAGFVQIVVGGVLDNAVGFLFDGGKEAPSPSSDDYIWIEPVGGGWYLFRTT
jgi:hypothetical protein